MQGARSPGRPGVAARFTLAPAMTQLSELLPASHILLDVAAADKQAAFEQAATLLAGSTGLKRGHIVDSLVARERMGSTGLGQGVAIPHGRVKGLRAAVACLIRTRAPIAFDAPDEVPVGLIFVLLVPEKSTDLHLEILSELAQMFSSREMRSALAAAPDALAAQRLIARWRVPG
jgi:PTS system nitrogen regulatory IIA component